MNQWARSRKRIILWILISFVVILVGIPTYFLFYKAPNCFDGKLNGDETGLDCGGSCQLLCSSQSLPLLLKGDPRVVTVATSTFQVVAEVENANSDADIYLAGYTLKIFNASSSVPVKTIEGETYVPKGSTFAIFEGPFTLEEGIVPTRAVLEWDQSSLVWQKNNYNYPELIVKDNIFSREDTTPRLEAIVLNTSLTDVANIDLTALVLDSNGNIFAASKTYIESLSAGESKQVVFTWPRPFGQEVIASRILIRLFPDTSFITR